MDRIQLRRDSSARWAEVNPILLEGEVGFETDTKLRKIGDGVHRWNELDYLKAEGIVQESGDGENVVMSQKVVTEKFEEVEQEINGTYKEYSKHVDVAVGNSVKISDTKLDVEAKVGDVAHIHIECSVLTKVSIKCYADRECTQEISTVAKNFENGIIDIDITFEQNCKAIALYAPSSVVTASDSLYYIVITGEKGGINYELNNIKNEVNVIKESTYEIISYTNKDLAQTDGYYNSLDVNVGDIWTPTIKGYAATETQAYGVFPPIALNTGDTIKINVNLSQSLTRTHIVVLDVNSRVIYKGYNEEGVTYSAEEKCTIYISHRYFYVEEQDANIEIRTSVADAITDIKSRISALEERAGTADVASYAISKYNKPMICLVDDDFGNLSKIDILKGICDDLGIKCSFAIYPTLDEDGEPYFEENVLRKIKQLYSEGFGFELHPQNGWETGALTSEINLAISKSMRVFSENNINHSDAIIVPGGNISDYVVETCRHWCSGLVASSNQTYNNGVEYDMMHLKRMFIDFEKSSTNQKFSMEYLKSVIDEAVEKGAWLIIGSHSKYFNEILEEDNTPTSNSWINYREILEYANQKCKLRTFSDCFRARKPMFELCGALGF